MRENMDRMEEERAEMMAEVEAQIERALASMAVDVDAESDYSDYSRPSRPSSRTSSHTFPRSRRASDAGKSRLPSIGTESTLAESYLERDIQDESLISMVGRETGTINEEDEEPLSPTKKKRFSASHEESQQDNMVAMDEGISQKSDKIAKKVLQIQQKVPFMSSTQFFLVLTHLAAGRGSRFGGKLKRRGMEESSRESRKR
jgi:EEF1A N-terminal glycine/lysine methyltransferase